MGTKEKILATALELFNEQGIDVVTIRHIAKEMGISHSNIQYYFKNADDIITTIYVNHINELNTLPVFSGEGERPGALRQSVTAILAHIYQYRFIYIHFVVIARRMPELRKVYAQRFKIRRSQFLLLFEDYRQQGIVRADIPATVWESLIQGIYMIGDFWISANELTTRLKRKKAVTHYADLLLDLFYPYLTEKGRSWMA